MTARDRRRSTGPALEMRYAHFALPNLELMINHTTRRLLRMTPVFLGLLVAPGAGIAAPINLLEISDKFDKADQQDFAAVLSKAKGCTRNRDFSCAERELANAGKLITRSEDRKALTAVRDDLATTKRRVEEEQRERQAAAERAQQAQSSNRYSGGDGYRCEVKQTGTDYWNHPMGRTYHYRFVCPNCGSITVVHDTWKSKYETTNLGGTYNSIEDAVRGGCGIRY